MTSDLDFDPNKIAADLIHRVIKDSTLSVASGFRAVLTKIFDVFRKDLTSYVEATIKKCSYIKTPIINRDHPTYIYDIYVHTKIALRKQIYTDDKLLSEIPKLKSIIIALPALARLCSCDTYFYHYAKRDLNVYRFLLNFVI